MPNSFTSLHYHLVFSTRRRERLITEQIERRVWEYLGAIASQNRWRPHKIGGVEDHIHVALSCPPTTSISKVAQLLKGSSSKWIHDEFPELRGFGWQDGYGAFSISQSNLPRVVSYIANQRQHHASQSFEDEFRALLERHGVEFDERYLFD